MGKKIRVKKINKKLILLTILIFGILILSVNLTLRKGTFEELVLNKLSSTNFNFVDIGRKDINTNLREQIYIDNLSKIEELINMLSKLNLLEVKLMPEYNNEFINMNYYIDIITESNDVGKEYIHLQFYEPSKYIVIKINSKSYNKEKVFKIIKGDVDFTFLNRLITD